MTVSQMLRSMSQSELTRWSIVFNKLEPFGERGADLRAGHITSPLLNALAGRNVSNPLDWVRNPFMEEETVETQQTQSSEMMKRIFKTFTERFKSVVGIKRRKKDSADGTR